MISYELAEKLKKAGLNWPEMGQLTISRSETFPQFEDLITGCGDDFICFERFHGGWKAIAYKNDFFIQEVAPTPIESMINLWLKLSRK